MASHVCGFVVRNKDVKTVKNVLEDKNLLHKNLKIRPVQGTTELHRSIIPSTLKYITIPEATTESPKNQQHHESELEALGLMSRSESLDLIIQVVAVNDSDECQVKSAFEKAIVQAIQASNLQELPCSLVELISVLPKSYSIYSPMLLLPFHTFRHSHWASVLSSLEFDLLKKEAFFGTLANRLSVTQIAINAIIPMSNSSTLDNEEDEENILRSPTNLQPVYGDFGPNLAAYPHHIPSPADYAHAFWVSTKQNGVNQVWAPRYTMFSAGNVTEKARLMTLSSVTAAVALGKKNGTGCAAVDLFAGIGYFAFSYVKAGCAKVLCWDLNPWSIEGLRRGAELNRYTAQVFDFEWDQDSAYARAQPAEDLLFTVAQHPAIKLVAFRETNQNALQRINRFRNILPPIRHVNCGTLPTIGEAWKIAVEALDSRLGGHIHLHETCPEIEKRHRADHYIELILQYARTMQRGGNVKVQLEYIETVKSIGPRLLHVVFDIRVEFAHTHDTMSTT